MLISRALTYKWHRKFSQGEMEIILGINHPPYSPDLNPLDVSGSWIANLRTATFNKSLPTECYINVFIGLVDRHCDCIEHAEDYFRKQ